MNVPKLRFKEFNDEYNITKVNEIVDVIDGDRGNKYPKENDFYESEFCLFLNAGNVTKNGFNFKNNQFITKEKDEKLRKGKLLINDIILTTRGTVGNVAWFNEKIPYKNIRINSGMVINRIKKNGHLLPEYLYSYMKTPVFETQVNKVNYGSAQPQLTVSSINNFNIQYPTINEQKKVSTLMLLLDKKIELQTKKIEDLKLFKKGLINHIIKNIETEKIPLKNILVEQNHKTKKNNEYEILSSTSKGLYLQKDYFNKQAASDNNVGYKILKKNQLVLSPQNLWMGNININSKYNIGIVSPSYKIFDINNNIDIDFFDYWIKSPKALYEYKISSEQGASIVRRNLNMNLFYEIKVDIPKGKIQNKIGKIIKLLNLKIQYNENSLQKLQEFKKGLMQNMFI